MPPEDRHSGVPGGGGSGVDVKSGTGVDLIEDSILVVTFNTPFASTPHVCVSFMDGDQELSLVQVETISTTGFTVRVLKIGGGSAVNRVVNWIATDASDP